MMELFLLLTEKKPNYWKSRVAFIPPINKIQLDFFNPKTTWNIRHSVFHRSGIFSIDQKVGSYCSFTLSKIQVIDIIENIYSDIWLFSICAEGSALSLCCFQRSEILSNERNILETFSNMDGNIFKIIWHDGYIVSTDFDLKRTIKVKSNAEINM